MAEFQINVQSAKGQIEQFQNIVNCLDKYQASAIQICNDLGFDIASRQGIRNRINQCAEQIKEESTHTKNLKFSYGSIIQQYENTEHRILGNGIQVASVISKFDEVNNVAVEEKSYIDKLVLRLKEKLSAGLIDRKTVEKILAKVGISAKWIDVGGDLISQKFTIDTLGNICEALGMDDKVISVAKDIYNMDADYNTLTTFMEAVGADEDTISIASDILNKKVDYETFDTFLKGINISETTRNSIRYTYDMVVNREGAVGKMIDNYYSGAYAKYEQKMKDNDYLGALVEYTKGIVIIPCGVAQVGGQLVVDAVENVITKITKKIDKVIPDVIVPDISPKISSWFDNLSSQIFKAGTSIEHQPVGAGGGGGSSWTSTEYHGTGGGFSW